jgi:small multidrug resistance family-3 protein
MVSLVFYAAATVVEIGDYFAFWAWLRLGKSVYWILPGIMSLVIFVIFLTFIESMFAGK